MTLCLLLVALVGWVAGFASAIWFVKWVGGTLSDRDRDGSDRALPLS
jgi:hypothetical protein